MTKAYTVPVGNPPSDVAELRRLIGETAGRFFSVLFVSRGKNEPRQMLARLKATPDPMLPWRDAAKRVDSRNHQYTVWDMQKRAWRVVPLERVVRFKCGPASWLTSVGGQA